MKNLLSPIRKTKYFLYFFASLNILVSLTLPFMLKDITDLVAKGDIGADFVRQCLLYFAVLLGFFITNTTQNYVWHCYIKTAVNLHRKYTIHHILKKPLSFFTKFGSGDIVSRLLQDTDIYGASRAVSTLMIVLNCLNLAGTLGFMFLINPLMAAMILLYIPIYFFVFKAINKRLRKYGKEERTLYAPLVSRSNEMIQGIETIHYDNQSDFFEARYVRSLDSFLHGAKRLQRFRTLGMSINTFLLGLLPFAVLVLGGVLVVQGNMTLGGLFAFYAYVQYLEEPIRNLTDVNINLQSSVGSKERLDEILNYPDDNQQNGRVLTEPISAIHFEDVDFHYEEKKDILKNFSLSLVRGDRLAISGPSGVGKSTLIKLLLGQLKSSRGDVRINSQSVQDIQSASYIPQIAYVRQNPFMFEGTMLENIAYGAGLDGVDKAFDIACLDTFTTLDALSAQEIRQNGENISGGERQRIAIARAILKDADVLILDEPTSALDTETERRFVQKLDAFLAQKPTMLICITHRDAILSICNKQLVFRGDAVADIREIHKAGAK